MSFGKIAFGFFILLAATLNFSFVYGELGNPAHHQVAELFAAIVVNLIATILKFGDRSQVGAVHMATSLVADLQLILAACVWALSTPAVGTTLDSGSTVGVVSLAAGALFANVVSVLLLIGETLSLRR